MLKVGITGGIGSGKTTVCRIFESLGIPVFYADEVAKRVMTSDLVLVEGIREAFGESSYSAAGELNRKHLADLVFSDTQQLEKLNALVHPAVFRAFDQWAASVKNAPYLLKEAALMFESGSYRMCDLNVLVTAPEELRILRVTQRDQITAEAVRQRMNKQFSDEQKIPMSDFVIVNDERSLLIPQVLQLHQHFLTLSNP
ncbi:MAG TPA: dephospho-CoA kinase [Sphingobacteriaceae bacterium]